MFAMLTFAETTNISIINLSKRHVFHFLQKIFAERNVGKQRRKKTKTINNKINDT